MNPGRPRLRDIKFTVTLPRACFEWLVEECKRRDPGFNPQSLRHKPARRISEILTGQVISAMIRHPVPEKPTRALIDPPECHGEMWDCGNSFFCFVCGRAIQKTPS